MFEDFAALAPLRGAAEALAEKSDWPPLYDLKALQSTTAPVASATYYDDMYVDCDSAQVGLKVSYKLHEIAHEAALFVSSAADASFLF